MAHSTSVEADARRAAEKVARESFGRLVSILVRQSRDIAKAEDALSDALAAALQSWPLRGIPDNPEAWLVSAARNRLKNVGRADQIRRLAEPEVERRLSDYAEQRHFPDERLALMFVCAHPAIDPAARAPLILQTILGLDASRIARAFLTEPATMSQRLVRAKTRIRDAGLRFALPDVKEMPQRLGAVLDAIYAAFGEGWDGLDQPESPAALTGEAIWLARLITQLMPDEPEPKGLLALMLYCSARRDARRDAAGRFVPLDQQDARRWNSEMIIEAEGLLTDAARAGRFGRYQCEAAIQSVHVQRPISGKLNRQALLTLYDLLVSQTDSVGAHIGRAVVIAELGEPDAALMVLDALADSGIRKHQPYLVARGHIAVLAGDYDGAKELLRDALALTDDAATRAHLAERLRMLEEDVSAQQEPA